MRIFRTLISLAVLAAVPPLATAEAPVALQTAVQRAVDTNPEVQTRWFTFRAAVEEQDALREGFLPSVDLAVGVGRALQRLPGQSSRSFNRYGASITLSQMLYDGFFTSSQVSRFGHVRMLRYYELISDAERVALEALEAYVDVLRYRDLVQFAKENYVEHKVVYDQIVERTRSGVGRGVDLELATGRLALSESNLLTEVANLHDVSARYVRIVGEQPAEGLEPVSAETLGAHLPESVTQALEAAYVTNPSLRAAVANIRAGQDQIDTRRAAFHPRLDLRLRQDLDRNLDRLSGDSREGTIELLLNYNLYHGGGDDARLRQAGEELNVARDTREKVCRDVRQTISIAYNEVNTLAEQLRYLDQHQLSMAKAREAYRQQFEIGQRSLLDLLDGENEYFDAQRAYAKASYDRLLAQARSLAGMGQLMQALGVLREDVAEAPDLPEDDAYVDLESICPPSAPGMLLVDKDALFEETMRAMGRR